MNPQTIFQEIASQVQLFQNIEQKETFIFVIGALTSRLISLHKAARNHGNGSRNIFEDFRLDEYRFFIPYR
ncbi:hypothetical protein ACQFX9_09855 [Aliinostoc sp. HNIBRCY26]|uniref:hypothetical protein n=1 Tax=Aliinostoc sp. HNIBRCY26 TaxID=3418997 RepID=UPI003CFD4AF2